MLLKPIAAIAFLVILAPVPAKSGDEDLLAMGEGRDAVIANCSACHSLMLVVQQGLSRSHWSDTLDYMVEEQGMEPLESPLREEILDYLARHYGTDHRWQPARDR